VNEDLSSMFEKLNINKDAISPEMIDNIRNMFNNISSSSDSTSSSKSPDIDMDTILKMKSIMDKINAKNDKPSSKLLYDLKPFLNESKQNKIDKYVKMDKMVELLPLIGGDLNTHLYSDNQALLFSLIALLF
jgi:hypothetical protein